MLHFDASLYSRGFHHPLPLRIIHQSFSPPGQVLLISGYLFFDHLNFLLICTEKGIS